MLGRFTEVKFDAVALDKAVPVWPVVRSGAKAKYAVPTEGAVEVIHGNHRSNVRKGDFFHPPIISEAAYKCLGGEQLQNQGGPCL